MYVSVYVCMYVCMFEYFKEWYVCMYSYDDYHVMEIPDFAASRVPGQPWCSQGRPMMYVCMYACSGK